MATEPDPFRTLGLAPSASLAEVKAAYRRLAKANHPDAAGAAALPRFLAIQAAYERLVGPAPGRSRSSAGTAARPPKPWEADPDRRDATYRAYGGRARRPASDGAGRPGSGANPSGTRTDGPTAGPAGATGSTGPSASAGSTGSAGPAASPGQGAKDSAGSGRSGRSKKATLGSTSYDEVERDTFEPDWGGASWYGTTSGTYWTINPKEYADPRKHGPEYQARARRARMGAPADDDPDAPIAADAEGPGATQPTGDARAEASRSDGGPDRPEAPPMHSTSSWWESTSGAAAAAAAGDAAPGTSRKAPPRPRPSSPPSTTEPGVSPPPSVSDVWQALAIRAAPTPGWRVARAIVGWIPIALAIGWATGELTGCGRFAATCDAGVAPIVWAVQALVFVVLLASSTIAGWAVVAALVALVVAAPATLFVTASAGATASQSGASFLGGVLGLAWLAGFVGAALHGRRTTPRPTGPVS